MSDLLDLIAKKLKSYGVDLAHLEARWIMEKYSDSDDVWEKVQRRCSGEPLAYILEEKGFYKHVFSVRPGVLIPRPETELVVEQALLFLKKTNLVNPVVFDFGCGSGCIGLSILAEASNARLYGFDKSSVAIETSMENSRKLNLSEKTKFLIEDLSKKNELSNFDLADVIVANPPYVKIGDLRLEAQVEKYEPHEALFGGESGLEMIEEWSKLAFRSLKPHGIFVLEFGQGQSVLISERLTEIGFSNILVYKDLAGNNRVLTAFKN